MDIKFPRFKDKKVFKKGSYEIDPNPFWNLVLFISALMIIFAFFFTLLLFKKVNKEVTLSSNDGTLGASTLPKDRIEKVLEHFKAREDKSKEILNSPAPIIDPSL